MVVWTGVVIVDRWKWWQWMVGVVSDGRVVF